MPDKAKKAPKNAQNKPKKAVKNTKSRQNIFVGIL
ncbi:hypothetical protein BRSU_2881 [Brachyspira suanatina]|uniref:Uncharacterized protein n=1 Tax=Brachyspira suanatina TaxID=381802 RepID=A0A0G4KBD4_9SPIR|nr:hypothetical protein BRSU_2881 [Brachyspira suanatina]